jgi:hypothetical protein
MAEISPIRAGYDDVGGPVVTALQFGSSDQPSLAQPHH